MHRTMERAAADAVAQPGAYGALLVHAEPACGHRVEVAARLARDIGARLIGLGAEAIDPAVYGGPYPAYGGGSWIALLQEEVEKNLVDAEAAFRRDAAGADAEWRTIQDNPSRALLATARAADLIVVSPRDGRDLRRSADPADVVLGAGLPVLIVPEDRSHLVGKSVVAAWKNTPECRRAISDALPLLQRAHGVVVAAVTKPEHADEVTVEIDDVVAKLRRRGVKAQPATISASGVAVEQELERIASLHHADLIVCGAYGHSRLREWTFGGVTAGLLHHPPCFVLLSH